MNLKYLRELFFPALVNFDPAKDKERADRYINLAYKEVYRAHRWEYRKRLGQITIIPRYTTGTATITLYDGTNEATAKTVTFSGASLTSAMVGRYFRPSGGEKWYKIVYISSNTAYLDVPVVDGASGSFEIWKRFYYVKSDAEDILDFGRWGDGKLENVPDLLDRHTDLSKEGSPPYNFSVFGIDPFDDVEYSTGSLEIAADSNVATGASTAWLSSGFDSGDIVQIDNKDYYIKRIESDARLVLNSYFSSAVASGTSYVFKKNNPLGFEFYNPSSDYDILPYAYLARPYDLIHETKDYIQLPDKFIPAIISRAQYFAFNDAKDERKNDSLLVYDAEMKGLKMKVNVVRPRYNIFAPKIHSGMPGRS